MRVYGLMIVLPELMGESSWNRQHAPSWKSQSVGNLILCGMYKLRRRGVGERGLQKDWTLWTRQLGQSMEDFSLEGSVPCQALAAAMRQRAKTSL